MIDNLFIGLCILGATAMIFGVAAWLADALSARLPRESACTLRRVHRQSTATIPTDLDLRIDGARRIP